MTTKPAEPESLSGPAETLPTNSVSSTAFALLALHRVAVDGVGSAVPIATALGWSPAGTARVLRALVKEGLLTRFGTSSDGSPLYVLAHDIGTRLAAAGSPR